MSVAVAALASLTACSGGGGGGGGNSPAPTGLTATYIAGNTVRLEWTNVATEGSGTRIERRPASGGSFEEIAVTDALATQEFEDAQDIALETQYEWRVRTVADDGAGKPSNIATDDPPPVPDPPAAAAGLTATVVNVNGIKLDWTHAGTDVAGFRIERKINYGDGFPWHYVAELPADARTYTDDCLLTATPYLHRVIAYNGANVEEMIETPNHTFTGAATMAPNAPINIAAIRLTPDSYRIQWENVCGQQDRLFVEVSVNGAAYQNVLSGTQRFSGDATWFLYVDLPQGSTYVFRVTAENTMFGATTSQTATATGPAAPPPATGGWISIPADYDNGRIYSDLVPSANATAYPAGKLPVGCFWSFNTFLGIQNFMCYTAAIHFQLSGTGFDLTGKTIDEAYLVMGVSSPPINPTNINCTAIATPWSQSTLNGNQSLNLYGQGASVQGSPAIFGPYAFDVTTIVQNWASGSAANHGILLEDAEYVFPYDSLIRTSWFFSTDEFGGDPKNKPTLWVSYR